MTAGAPQYWFPKPYADFVQRLRVACGFLLLITFALLSHATVDALAIGLPVSLAGLAIRAWAAGHLEKNQQLTTSGPYAFVRNPLYIGTLLTALGLVIAARSGPLTVVFICAFLLIYLPVIELEEQHLRSLFPEYGVYAARVHRLLPLTRWNREAKPFSWAVYRRNKEHKAALGFLVAIIWLVIRLPR